MTSPSACTARRSNGPTPQPAQMNLPLGSVPRCADSPTAQASSRSGMPSGLPGRHRARRGGPGTGDRGAVGYRRPRLVAGGPGGVRQAGGGTRLAHRGPGTDQDETPDDVKDLLAEDDPAGTP